MWDTLHSDLRRRILSEHFRGMWKLSKNTRLAVKNGEFEKAAKLWMDSDEYRNADAKGRPGVRKRYEALRDALLAEAKRRDK